MHFREVNPSGRDDDAFDVAGEPTTRSNNEQHMKCNEIMPVHEKFDELKVCQVLRRIKKAEITVNAEVLKTRVTL